MLGLSGLFLSFSLACAPSTEGETKSYERNKIELTELGAKWPGFKTVADAKVAAVDPVWQEAMKVGDEEKKAAAMKAANGQFDPLLNKMQQVKTKSEGLDDTMGKLRRIKLDKAKSSQRNDTLENAQEVLDEVEAKMQAGTPEDEAAAVAICDEQISSLISTAGTVDRMHDKYKKKVKLKGKKKGKKK